MNAIIRDVFAHVLVFVEDGTDEEFPKGTVSIGLIDRDTEEYDRISWQLAVLPNGRMQTFGDAEQSIEFFSGGV